MWPTEKLIYRYSLQLACFYTFMKHCCIEILKSFGMVKNIKAVKKKLILIQIFLNKMITDVHLCSTIHVLFHFYSVHLYDFLVQIWFSFWAAALEETKSCRIQGDFCLFFRQFLCSFVCPPLSGLSDLKSALFIWNALSQAWNLPSQMDGRTKIPLCSTKTTIN